MKKTFDYYILFFFTVALIGWLWEVLLYLVVEHRFVNRGVYVGPYLPVYGFGGLLICTTLQKFRKKKRRTFFLSAMMCTALEYVSSWFLEWNWGFRWWDYSEQFWNLDGRICFLAAFGFGFGGMLLNCYAIIWFERLYKKSR